MKLYYLLVNYIKFARVSHWLKGIVIILPIVFSGKFIDYTLYIPLFKTFIIFGLVSSISYCINDIKDYQKDKLHKYKSLKPLASKRIDLNNAKFFLLLLSLFTIFIIIYWKINYNIKVLLIIYFCISTIYTFFLKKLLFLEVIIVSTLYQLRLFAGCFTIFIFPSILMATQVYLITTLIFFCKRYSDIFLSIDNSKIFSLYVNKEKLLIKVIYFLFVLCIINYIFYFLNTSYVNIYSLIKLLVLVNLIGIGLFEFINKSIKNKMASDPVKLILSSYKIIFTFLIWLLIEIISKIKDL